MENITRSEFEGMQNRNALLMRDMEERIINSFNVGIGGVHDRLNILNGKTNKAVTDIGVLQERTSKDHGARWGAGIGVLISILMVLWKVFGG